MPARTTTGIRKAPAECGRGRREKALVCAMVAYSGTQFAFRLAAGMRMRLTGGRRARRYSVSAAGAVQDTIGRTTWSMQDAHEQCRRTGNAYRSNKEIHLMASGKNRSIKTLAMCFSMICRNARRAPGRAADADAEELGAGPHGSACCRPHSWR